MYAVFYVVQLTVLLLNAVHPCYTRLTPVLHPHPLIPPTPAPTPVRFRRYGYYPYPYPRIFRTTGITHTRTRLQNQGGATPLGTGIVRKNSGHCDTVPRSVIAVL